MHLERQEAESRLAARLSRVQRAIESLTTDRDGVTAIEYALLAALIVLVVMGSISLLGGGVNGMWTIVANAVVSAL